MATYNIFVLDAIICYIIVWVFKILPNISWSIPNPFRPGLLANTWLPMATHGLRQIPWLPRCWAWLMFIHLIHKFTCWASPGPSLHHGFQVRGFVALPNSGPLRDRHGAAEISRDTLDVQIWIFSPESKLPSLQVGWYFLDTTPGRQFSVSDVCDSMLLPFLDEPWKKPGHRLSRRQGPTTLGHRGITVAGWHFSIMFVQLCSMSSSCFHICSYGFHMPYDFHQISI